MQVPDRQPFGRSPNLCHPERSLAMSKANRQTKSKDPVPFGSAAGDSGNSPSSVARALILGALVLMAIPSFAQISMYFPGPKSELSSRDGRYVLQNIDRDEEPKHSILLKDKTTAKTRTVYVYLSRAVVFWSPDSTHFAIDDISRGHVAYIFAVDETAQRIDIQNELQETSHIDPANGDNQFDLARWLHPERVVVLSWRYSKDRPQRVSCHCYIYTLNGAVEKCSKHPEEPDLEELCPDLLKRP